MSRKVLRFLLDQNFPEPEGFDMRELDATVEYEHVRKFDASLTRRQTPDWLIYLRAQEAGFDGLVTRDWHQSAQAEEMFALTRTNLTLVTWRHPIEDPVVEWGQLLAYMPEIRRMMANGRGRVVILLPRPHLESRSIEKAGDLLGELARDQGVATGQLRQQAMASIRQQLADRKLDERLGRFVERAARRPPKKS